MIARTLTPRRRARCKACLLLSQAATTSNNRLHSFFQDQRWRRAAVRAAGVDATTRVLDVACGTGDLAEAFADAGAAEVTGVDFTPEMLAIARDKGLRNQGAPRARRDGRFTRLNIISAHRGGVSPRRRHAVGIP